MQQILISFTQQFFLLSMYYVLDSRSKMRSRGKKHLQVNAGSAQRTLRCWPIPCLLAKKSSSLEIRESETALGQVGVRVPLLIVFVHDLGKHHTCGCLLRP